MKKKTLALLLVLALLAALFAGCGSSTAATETAAEAEPAAAAAEAQPAAEAETAAAAAETEAAPEAEAVVQTEADITAPEAPSGVDVSTVPSLDGGVTYVSPCGVEYPIGDGSQSVSFWTSFGGFWIEYLETYDDMLLLPYITDQTGVNYDFIEVSESAATEQFSLLVASGDWPDTIQATDYYTGGLGQAYEDEFIADLTDLLPDCAPDYYAALNGTNETTVKSLLTDGMNLAVYAIKDAAYSDRGGALRGDWAEALGYDPAALAEEITLSDFTDLLYAMQETYASDTTLYMATGASSAAVGQAFGVSLPSISSPTSLTVFRNDGEIVCSFTQEGFRDYLEWFHTLYSDKIINNEFYVADMTEIEMFTEIAAGQIGAWTTAANVIDGVLDYTEEAIVTTAIPSIIADDARGQITEWGSDTVLADNKGYSVCADCEDIETVLRFYNYFFTEPGAVFCNYGVEGLTWDYTEDGTIDYNDKIYNDPEGISPMVAQNLYTFSMMPRFMYVSTQYTFYTDASLVALDTWMVREYQALHNIPTDASLTTAETSSISNEVNDILAYTSEMILKFMTGTEELTDDSWTAYCDQCEKLGLSKCLEVYQNAYDEYLRGDRVAEASSGSDGGSAPPAPGDGEDGGAPPAP